VEKANTNLTTEQETKEQKRNKGTEKKQRIRKQTKRIKSYSSCHAISGLGQSSLLSHHYLQCPGWL